MEPHDFELSPEHPEFETQEAMSHASQETLENLYEAIAKKLVSGKSMTSLFLPGEQRSAATVSVFAKGANKTDPTRIGQIHTSELINENEGIATNYFILDTPDGLQIEKHRQVYDNRDLLTGEESQQQKFAKLRSGLTRAHQVIESIKVQTALGFSFVSEQEAEELIGFVEPLAPKNAPTQ